MIIVKFAPELRPILKHATHDQQSHGSWAKGNFDEDTQGEDAQNLYFDTYGIKTDGSKEPVGISLDEVKSLDYYTGDGYKTINQRLRRGGSINENKVADLDKIIQKSPDLFNDKTLYRLFSNTVLQDLNNGDVLTDKAFLSTTRVDITDSKNIETLQNLQLISEADTRAAVLLPNPSKSGKGLAVDYLKNAVSDLFNNVSTANSEKEVLLPRNTSLKYMGLKVVSGRTEDSMVVAVFQRMDE